MKCPKCSGYVVDEPELAEGGWILDRKCINCGERKAFLEGGGLTVKRRELNLLPKGKEGKIYAGIDPCITGGKGGKRFEGLVSK